MIIYSYIKELSERQENNAKGKEVEIQGGIDASYELVEIEHGHQDRLANILLFRIEVFVKNLLVFL